MIMKRILTVSLVFFLSVSAAIPTKADVSDSLSRALDEVVVAVSRLDFETIPVQKFEGGELQRLSTYSVADALRYFSGIQIKDYGGIGGLKTVNVRSMGSEHTGVFIDGIKIDNAQNGTVDLGRFSLDNMESITMYNGQKSSIFQSASDYASASTIYLRTKRPVFELSENKSDFSNRNNLNIGLKYGSFDTWNPSVLWEHKLNSDISTSISAEYMNTSGRYKFRLQRKDGYDTVMVRQNGDVEALRAEVSLFGNSEPERWMAKAYVYSSERGYPGAVIREEPGKLTHRDRQWDTDFFVQGNWQRDFSALYSMQVQAKYAYDYLHYYSDPGMDAAGMFVDNTYRQNEAYASTAHLFALTSWWSASLSADFKMNTLDADKQAFVKPLRYTALAALSMAFDWNRFDGQISGLYTYVDDHVKKGTAPGTKNLLTPSIALSWQPTDSKDWNLRAFYKRIFRMPTLNELYYTVIDCKPLDPEFSTQYNIGTTWSRNMGQLALSHISLQIDAYFNQVENKIVALPASNQFRWTMMNIGYVEIYGVDAAVQSDWNIGNTRHGLRLTYTYQDAKDLTDRKSMWYGGQIPYIPHHSGSVIYSGDWRRWSWNYSFIYTGGRYESVANIQENYEQPWYTHDLSVGRDILFNDYTLRFSAEVNNIFNQQYEVVRCYPMPGINWRLKINFIL